MVTVLADQHKVRFFGSPDLKRWEILSDFGPAGATGGVWECPDLFPLAVDGNAGDTRWVLDVDINPGGQSRAARAGSTSSARFDGTSVRQRQPAGQTLWVDYGKDFYATISFSDIPASDGRRIWMGWMSNWLYANEEPTAPWRGVQSVPRVLPLRRLPEGIRLVQAPVAELDGAADRPSRADRGRRAAAAERRDRARGRRGRSGGKRGCACPTPPAKRSSIGVRAVRPGGVRRPPAVARDRLPRGLPGRHAGPVRWRDDRSRSGCCSIDPSSRSSRTTARRSSPSASIPPRRSTASSGCARAPEAARASMWELRSVWRAVTPWPRSTGDRSRRTKFVCVVGAGPDDIRAETRFPTTTPEATLRNALEFFRSEQVRPGPAGGRRASRPSVRSTSIPPRRRSDSSRPRRSRAGPTSTWRGPCARRSACPSGFDTDVNAAALAEGRWGAAQGLDSFLYLTVGTGHRRRRPRRRAPDARPRPSRDGPRAHPARPAADPFAGVCPFHGDCLEGLASGPAIRARWGQPAEELPDDHPAWALEAHYLALALVNFVCTFSPRRIVIGGGVMSNPQLLPLIRTQVVELLNNYVRAPEVVEQIDEYIVAPASAGARACWARWRWRNARSGARRTHDGSPTTSWGDYEWA